MLMYFLRVVKIDLTFKWTVSKVLLSVLFVLCSVFLRILCLILQSSTVHYLTASMASLIEFSTRFSTTVDNSFVANDWSEQKFLLQNVLLNFLDAWLQSASTAAFKPTRMVRCSMSSVLFLFYFSTVWRQTISVLASCLSKKSNNAMTWWSCVN